MANNEKETNVVENESPTQLQKVSDKVPVAKREVIEVNKDTINAINLFDEKQLIAAENFLTKISRSEKGGIKSVNEGLAILMRAQDLKLPFSSCLEHIHVINGKTGIDIHIIKALLSKAGCFWRCVKDYQPLYEYTDGINAYTDDKLPDYAIRCKDKKEADELSEKDTEKEHIYLYPTRYYQDLNGNIYKDYNFHLSQPILQNSFQYPILNNIFYSFVPFSLLDKRLYSPYNKYISIDYHMRYTTCSNNEFS